MTLYEYLDREIPDYYPSMYLDGYEPHQILHGARRKILQEHEAREDLMWFVAIQIHGGIVVWNFSV